MQDSNRELVEYLDEKFSEINTKVDGLKSDFQVIQKSVDSFALTAKTNVDELKAVNKRIDDHRDWIQNAGAKIDLEFRP